MSAPATEQPDLEQLLAHYHATQGKPGKPAAAKKAAKKQPAKVAVRAWVVDHRRQLTILGSSLMLGPAGDLLAAADDGWKTAIAAGVAGAATAGAWGWVPGVWKWRRVLPAMNQRIIALSAPVTGSTLLTTMAATGGPEWGHNPWWGFSLAWSAAYGTWFIRRHNRAPQPVEAPKLTQQMLDWIEHVAKVGGAYPKSKLVSPVSTGNGWTAEVLVPRGEVFEIKPMAIASAYDVNLALVAMEPLPGSPRRGRLTIMDHNPLQTGTLFGQDNVLDPETGIANVGVFYDGGPAAYRFFMPGSGVVHSLVTGTSGSGKSRLFDGLLAIEKRTPLVSSVVVDPQGGQSLPDWPEGVFLFAPSVELGIQVLRMLKAIVNDRSARYGRMKWIDDKGRTRIGRAFFVPGDPDPIISFTLDEAHQVLNHAEYGAEAVTILGDIGKMARKCGVKIRLGNQNYNASELGGDTVLRDILIGGNNVVLRSGSTSAGKRAAGSALDGVDPASIPREWPDGTSTGGLGYIAGPDGRTAMFRSAYVDDPFELAQEGEITPFEAELMRLPIVQHVLAEHARFVKCREAGEEYVYDPESFQPDGEQPVVLVKTAPATPTTTAAAPAGTAEKIAAYLRKTGRPTAPAVIAKALGLTGPQVRQCLKRLKDKPGSPIVALDHGAYVHADHADDYATAA